MCDNLFSALKIYQILVLNPSQKATYCHLILSITVLCIKSSYISRKILITLGKFKAFYCESVFFFLSIRKIK